MNVLLSTYNGGIGVFVDEGAAVTSRHCISGNWPEGKNKDSRKHDGRLVLIVIHTCSVTSIAEVCSFLTYRVSSRLGTYIPTLPCYRYNSRSGWPSLLWEC